MRATKYVKKGTENVPCSIFEDLIHANAQQFDSLMDDIPNNYLRCLRTFTPFCATFLLIDRAHIACFKY